MVTLETRLFEQVRIAYGLAEEEDPRQISTLLCCMGKEEDEVLRASYHYSEDDSKKYNKVIETFQKLFQVRCNVIFERTRFHRRSQHVHELIEQYITALYSLADTCKFAAWMEDMIRDRTVVGINSDQASLARIVNKGICGERMVWCCVAAECTNSRKSYAIVFRFPKIPS